MSKETELYRLELEQATEIFGTDKFLSVSELSRRTGRCYESVRALFAGEIIPSIGISKARFALALSKVTPQVRKRKRL